MKILGTSGHRPQKSGATPLKLRLFAQVMLMEIRPDKVITGMAVGWDQAVAEACIDTGIPFIAAIPFEGQDERWPAAQRLRYSELLQAASERVYVSRPGFSLKKMQARNQWIVDHSTEMMVLYDGMGDSGTADCVERAERAGLVIRNVWKGWWSYRG